MKKRKRQIDRYGFTVLKKRKRQIDRYGFTVLLHAGQYLMDLNLFNVGSCLVLSDNDKQFELTVIRWPRRSEHCRL